MRIPRWNTIVAVAVTSAVFVAACGGDDDSYDPKDVKQIDVDCTKASDVAALFDFDSSLHVAEQEGIGPVNAEATGACAYSDSLTRHDQTFSVDLAIDRYTGVDTAEQAVLDFVENLTAYADECDEDPSGETCEQNRRYDQVTSRGTDEAVSRNATEVSPEPASDEPSAERLVTGANHNVLVRQGDLICSAHVYVADINPERFDTIEEAALQLATDFCDDNASAA